MGNVFGDSGSKLPRLQPVTQALVWWNDLLLLENPDQNLFKPLRMGANKVQRPINLHHAVNILIL